MSVSQVYTVPSLFLHTSSSSLHIELLEIAGLLSMQTADVYYLQNGMFSNQTLPHCQWSPKPPAKNCIGQHWITTRLFLKKFPLAIPFHKLCLGQWIWYCIPWTNRNRNRNWSPFYRHLVISISKYVLLLSSESYFKACKRISSMNIN